MDNKDNDTGSLSLVLGGEAGQGIQFIETILKTLIKRSGYYVFATKEYMSRIRGGINTTEIRISKSNLFSHVDTIDILVPLKQGVIPHLGTRITDKTVILGDASNIKVNKITDIPFNEIASDYGNRIYANSVALGAISALLHLDEDILFSLIEKKFALKGSEIAKGNIQAAKAGIEAVKSREGLRDALPMIEKSEAALSTLVLSGADAVAIGALAGGCNCAYAYPMTPGTSVFTLLADYSRTNDILVEQVEDEISAVNMALGSWYAGAKPMVSTAGGGFALMTEGVSLAGMMESPLVVHIAGRPGPATGLPTRTEQADLNLARYAGHGEFSRVILAPGTVEQAYSLSKYAFEFADEFQVPVFILTDQYFVDSYATIPPIEVESPDNNLGNIVETAGSYKRYRLTDDGVSPRGIPGYGTGTVCVDSDEHDESGRITEDLDGVHMQMADKRARKHELVKSHAIAPELLGSTDYTTLLVSWGSNYGAVVEAMSEFDDDVAFLFCPQVYPLHESMKSYLEKADKVIFIENNQVGQFADLCRTELCFESDARILKYNGMPFSVEELTERIGAEL